MAQPRRAQAREPPDSALTGSASTRHTGTPAAAMPPIPDRRSICLLPDQAGGGHRRGLVRHRGGGAAGARGVCVRRCRRGRRSRPSALQTERENRVYLPGVELPRELRIEHVERRAGARRLRVPRRAVGRPRGGDRRARADAACPTRRRSCRWPRGWFRPTATPPTVAAARPLRRSSGPPASGGPAHAQEMVSEGAGLVAASTEESLAKALAGVFIRAGVVCEESNDPIGVELAGAAKNAAALASGATEAQGLNAAGAAAGHIFAEVWRWAEAEGARPESMIGLAGTGDLVATALAPAEPQPPRRRAARPGCAGGRNPGPGRAGGRGAGVGSAAGPGAERGRRRGAGDARARPADLRRAAARGVGGGRARDGAAAGALAPAPCGRVLAALARARLRWFTRRRRARRLRDVYWG